MLNSLRVLFEYNYTSKIVGLGLKKEPYDPKYALR